VRFIATGRSFSPLRALLRLTLPLALLAVLATPTLAQAPAITVTTLAERTVPVSALPAGTLVWRIETLPSGDAAVAATGSTGVAATYGGRSYLVTLAPAGGATPGATRVAETAAVPVPRSAQQVVLRISSLTGPQGAESAVHSHPGAEGYLVLRGEFGARSDAGTNRVPAGRTIVGPPAGSAVQALNTGAGDVDVLVMFSLDASQPASSPASFANPANAMRVLGVAAGLPATGAPLPFLLITASATGCALAGIAIRRALPARRR
jgi:quercetin dioxygenase-like cupin family protein